MTILLLLVPLSLVLLAVAIAAFVWAVRSGQFEDLDTPPLNVLADDHVLGGAQAPPPPRPSREQGG